mmetsp:Transcript_142110/g.247665  ORF Transcript_142110/g.247665 Transcript_142110/m.247665 type:complete len:84 (-) Transcript_142110:181-432(-)
MVSITNSQTVRTIYICLQILILMACIGIVGYSLMTMEGDMARTKVKKEDHCCRRNTALVVVFAFVTGGLMNIEGFASLAALLL